MGACLSWLDFIAEAHSEAQADAAQGSEPVPEPAFSLLCVDGIQLMMVGDSTIG
jgi:hypothetical protein